MSSKEDELYYNNFFDMFRSEGWKQLLEELKSNVEMLDQVAHIKDTDDLRNKQGQLLVLNNLLNLEDTLVLAYEDSND
jgi:aromatic ring-cleaving dioxygenase